MEKKGITQSRLIETNKQINKTVELINKLNFQMFDEIKSELILLKAKIKLMINENPKLINIKGKTDKEKQEIECIYNPELHYSFKHLNKGIEIVLTDKEYDTEQNRIVKSKKHYSIKAYNCYLTTFKDKRDKLTSGYRTTYYGNFDNLDKAIKEYRRAIIDVCIQVGKCNALSPLDFY